MLRLAFVLLGDLSKERTDKGPRLSKGTHVLLDFQNSLDDDNQWQVNNGQLIFVRTGDYRTLFMRQIGKRD